ncbi:hypothetical protein F9802_11090 [Bacillus aerolatus]|uniref:Uncharacterized protein n=1 Tax=Bacillus aerolatus TaxID=2653354 RepID=A0A6I1FJC5_9BACI|nr:hypothetical protein [Bacillus aerolatus]KAB7706129.1 hypothetical protein F9802_11090 [Bacillus aerolatus]
MKKWTMTLGAVLLAGGVLAACSETETKQQSTDEPAEETTEEVETETEVQPAEEKVTEEPADTETTETPEAPESSEETATDSTEGTDTNTDTETTTEEEEVAAPEKEPAATEDTDNQQASEEQPADIVETKGVFNGVADPHTVEIEVDGQPQAFQVAPDSEAMKKFDQMKEGTEITFVYKKEGEQMVIQELK